jgi:D-proline reductase (dithiol) PrdB
MVAYVILYMVWKISLSEYVVVNIPPSCLKFSANTPVDKEVIFMADRQSPGQPPEEPAPEALSLLAFARSLYHGERADNFFKFLKNLSEEDIANFMQKLLQQVGNAIDDRSTVALTQFVQQAQAKAYAPTQSVNPNLPDFPDSPFAPFRKPLHEVTIALFTSGAVYLDDQEPFYPAELTYEQALRQARRAFERFPSLRVIPVDIPEERLRVGHLAYDIRAAQKDINVIFPLTRFRELVQEGVIGALAERNYSYHGLTNMPRLIHETAPQWAQMLKEDGVDAVFLTSG